MAERPGVVKTLFEWGEVDKAFTEADIVKEFTYSFSGAIPVPMQPNGCVAKWDGDKVTIWGMGQSIYNSRNNAAKKLGIPPENIRFVDKWNGGSFGGALPTGDKFYAWVAYIAKQTGRPAKLMLPKNQELAFLQIKPQTLSKFKVGATKDGKITVCQREFHVSMGANQGGVQEGGGGRSELYLHVVPNWREIGVLYRTNAIVMGSSRSNYQQEFKWAWEQMMDEMAEAVGVDPVQFRLMNVQKPGTKVALKQGGPTIVPMPETENGFLHYDSYASVEVLQEGAKAIGWDKRNPVPGGNPGRFKRGFGVAMSQHHAGRVGYQEGEPGYDWVLAKNKRQGNVNPGGEGDIFNAELELNSEGQIVMHFAQPDSGTNHGTSMSIQVGEILGFTSLDHIRLIWGDSEQAPSAPPLAQRPDNTTARRGALQCRGQDAQGPVQPREQRTEGGCGEASGPRRRDLLDGRSKEKDNLRGACQSQQGKHQADRPVPASRGHRQGAEPRHRDLLCRGRSGHLDGRLALRQRGVRARLGQGHEPAPGQCRSAWIVDPEHVRWLRTAFRGTANFRERSTTASAIYRTGCPRSWSLRSRPTYS